MQTAVNAYTVFISHFQLTRTTFYTIGRNSFVIRIIVRYKMTLQTYTSLPIYTPGFTILYKVTINFNFTTKKCITSYRIMYDEVVLQ